MPIPKPSEEDKSNYTYLKIKKENERKYVGYGLYLMHHLESKHKRLGKIFRDFCDFIEFADADKKAYHKKLKNDTKKRLVDFIKKPGRDYDFVAGFEDNKMPYNAGYLSFYDMITKVIESSVSVFEKHDKMPVFARHCYRKIDDYIKQDPTIKTKYTHYKVGVLVGFLTYEFGYEPSSAIKKANEVKIELTTDLFFKYVESAIKDINSFPEKKRKEPLMFKVKKPYSK